MEAQPHPELLDANAGALLQRLARGELTARRLVGMYLERIEALDRAGPALRAILEINPDAADIAEERDRERAAGRLRGPLHGIPVVLKDNIDTGDRMLTTAGSLALAGAPAARDADLVVRLRASGAVILAKANLSEWANFRSTRSSSGWSGRGRQCRNPHVLDRTPSGSSSGSAVAVAAGLAPLAVGTETDGSIVSPSSANGVVGIKPTVGLISQRGIVPISASQDSAGPHATSVRDAALLLGALTDEPADFTGDLDAGVQGIRIGVLRQPFTGYSEHTDAVYESALRRLREAGAELIDPVELETAQELRESGLEAVILQYEFKAGLNAYLATRNGVAVHSLEDVIRFNLDHAHEEMPYFRQEILEASQARSTLEDEEYRDAIRRSRELARDRGIDATLDRNQLGALIAPGAAPAAVVDQLNGDRRLGGSSQPSAMAGYPIISVPAGAVFDALPVNVNFFGRPHSERLLLRIAQAFERAAPPRLRPRFLPSLELP